MRVLLLLLRRVGTDKQLGETNDGIERCAYLVAHIGKESRLEVVQLVCLVLSLDKHALHILARRNELHRAYKRLGGAVVVAFAHNHAYLIPLLHHTLAMVFLALHVVLHTLYPAVAQVVEQAF